jgi:hypothetical protein
VADLRDLARGADRSPADATPRYEVSGAAQAAHITAIHLVGARCADAASLAVLL